MRKLVFILITVIAITSSCKEEKKATNENDEVATNYVSFGDKITTDNYLSKKEMYNQFKSLKKGDTIDVKFASSINSVCKKKGCWMRLDLDNGKNTLVRFKDYGFFMPLNSENKEVIVSGRAFVDIISVEELRHYAKDEGLSEEEINKITEDEVIFAVESDGVLMGEE